jgi:protein TonB
MQGTMETGPPNGTTHDYGADGLRAASSFAIAGGPAVPYDDPMSKVLGLDAKTSGLGAWFGFTSGSTALLAGLMALASAVAWMHTMHALSAGVTPEEIEVVKEEAPPPPPAPVAESKPEPAPPPARAVPHEPPPPPAQAAKVLTQEPDPNEPVDLTGNTIVQGNADAYAGGFTTKNGTNANAARAIPSPTGVPGGTGAVQAPPPGPDRSRAASLAGSRDWNAPFPAEADTVQIDEAYVTLQIDVRADGTPAAVRILSDPGNGFGREARRYAMTQRYAPALDREGNPVPGTIGPIRVHFSR